HLVGGKRLETLIFHGALPVRLRGRQHINAVPAAKADRRERLVAAGVRADDAFTRKEEGEGARERGVLCSATVKRPGTQRGWTGGAALCSPVGSAAPVRRFSAPCSTRCRRSRRSSAPMAWRSSTIARCATTPVTGSAAIGARASSWCIPRIACASRRRQPPA